MIRRAPFLVLIALTLVSTVAASCADRGDALGEPVAQVDPATLTGGFVVEVEPLDADTERWADTWTVDGLLAALVEDMDESIALPRDVTIVLDADDGPYYDPGTASVFMPVGFADEMAELLESTGLPVEVVDELVAQNAVFVLLHEIGHALIDVLDLPITAREEDSVDALAVVLMTLGDLEESGEGGEKLFGSIPLAAAAIFDAMSLDAQYDETDYWDEHSLAPQRAATIACLTYGSDPAGFAELEQSIDEHRVQRCESEFAQVARGWLTLLEPYMDDVEL